MKVLLINKYHYLRGGAERYYFNVSKLLKLHGHKVAYFEKDIKQTLDSFGPDIVHIHNIYYHLPASIIGVVKRRGIPIVYTVHDYHLISSDMNMYYKNRNPLFLLGFYLFMFINKLLWINSRNIDYFLAPSKFMRRKLIGHGYGSKKVAYIPNFTFTKDKTVSKTGKYVLFFGQLLEHKGVQILIKAAAKAPTIKYKIAGDGKYKKSLLELVNKLKIKNVEFLGKVNEKKLENLILNARVCMVPSLWPENCPMTILEAFALKKTVIASDIGGIPEIVEDGKNGLLFDPGDSDDLAEKIRLLWNNPKLAEKLGSEGLKTVKEKFSPEVHYKKLMIVYNKTLNN